MLENQVEQQAWKVRMSFPATMWSFRSFARRFRARDSAVR
jgi:hypothetical protein